MKDFITIKDASILLGVSAGTLRNWEKKGQLPSTRNPFNNYRLYVRSDIEKIKKKIRRKYERTNETILSTESSF
jgi:DNA-binding transcriptional MerR regulator